MKNTCAKSDIYGKAHKQVYIKKRALAEFLRVLASYVLMCAQLLYEYEILASICLCSCVVHMYFNTCKQ